MTNTPEYDRRTFVSAVAATAGMGSLAGCGFLGSQGSPPEEMPPQVSFSMGYDHEAKILEITHDGGDAIAKSALEVRGDGFEDVGDADQTSAGTWRGDASETVDGNPAITQGDSVTVGAGADYDLQLVWTASEENGPQTLATAEGPDA